MLNKLVGVALCLMTASALCADTPRLFFSDIESGPKTGGENNKGAFVTLFGRHFGATRGSSVVTIGGGAADNYPVWTERKITLQLGAAAQSGNIVVTVNGQSSNAVPFAVRGGSIYFAATTGNDSSAGSFAAPWRTLAHAVDTISAGDIIYALNGVAQTAEHRFGASLCIESGGTQALPCALIAYPGASVSIGTNTVEYGMRIPNIGVSPNYWIFSQLKFRGLHAVSLGGESTGWRLIGNDLSSPLTSGHAWSGCFVAGNAQYVKFLGNYVHDSAARISGAPTKGFHEVYFSTDSSHIEVAWNEIKGGNSFRGLQFHSSPLGGDTGQNQYDLSVHDNYIHDTHGDGINFATVDPSKGKVEAYNNLLVRCGTGVLEGDIGNCAGVYVAGTTNIGAAGSGTVEVYNNTLYDCGSARYSGSSGGFMNGGGNPNLRLRLRNNLCVALAGEVYTAGATALINGSNNLWFGVGGGPTTKLTNNVNADPLFVSVATTDFHLQSGSPAINAGIATGLATDFDGGTRPVGAALDLGAFEYGSSIPPQPTPPAIMTQPVNASVTAGQTASFSVVASGTAPLSYQWQKNGAAIAGATATSYTTPATTLADSGSTFRCIVTNSLGHATSDAATLTVSAVISTPPSVVTQPVSQRVVVGQSATFNVAAEGTLPLSYQWQKNAANISGANAASYTTPATTTADNGATFRCVVTNSIGTATSNTATLTVTAAPQGQTLLTTQMPLEQANSDGADVNYELGLRFKTNVNGTITAIRFWKAASESGTHVGRIWSASGTQLVATTFTSETASGWQEQALASPLTISANSEYLVSVNTGNTYYVSSDEGLATQIVNSSLSSIVGSNGRYGPAGQYPTQTWMSSNYFRDVRFLPSSTPVNNPPVITSGPLATPNPAVPGQSISLAVAANDPEGAALSYRWSFGDGTTATGNNASHSYAAAGMYSVSVSVDDGVNTVSANTTVQVSATVGGSGLRGEYFDNLDFTALKFTRIDRTLNFNWGTGAPSGLGANTFSVRWSGQVLAKFSELYTFYTVSDDGVRLWVNGVLLVNNWTRHAATENRGNILLTAGVRYDIKMEFYENSGNAVARLSWSSVSQLKQVIPQSQLFPAALTAGAAQPAEESGAAVGILGGEEHSDAEVVELGAVKQHKALRLWLPLPSSLVGAKKLKFQVAEGAALPAGVKLSRCRLSGKAAELGLHEIAVVIASAVKVLDEEGKKIVLTDEVRRTYRFTVTP